jgi:hypothetical protein
MTYGNESADYFQTQQDEHADDGHYHSYYDGHTHPSADDHDMYHQSDDYYTDHSHDAYTGNAIYNG